MPLLFTSTPRTTIVYIYMSLGTSPKTPLSQPRELNPGRLAIHGRQILYYFSSLDCFDSEILYNYCQDDEDVGDEEMFALDDMLANAFKAMRKGKKEDKVRQKQIMHFKVR